MTYDDENYGPPPPVDDPQHHDAPNVTPLRHNPQQNLPAERALLGAVLLEPERALSLLELVNPDDFYDHRHEQIWSAIGQVITEHGLQPDAPTLTAHLAANSDTARLIGMLPDLATNNSTPAQASHYARLIADTALVRRLATKIASVQQRLLSTTPDLLHLHVAEGLQEFEDAAYLLAGVRQNDAGLSYTTFDGLFSKPRTPTPWLIAPILAAGRVSLLYAPGKTGKSLVAMEAAVAAATGRPAFATDTPAPPRHVLYIDQEMTEDDWIDRLREMGYGPADEHLLGTYLHLAQLQAWPPMDTAAGGKAVEAAALATGAEIVIIDTASKVIAGEENSNDTQQAFYRHTLIPLKRAGVAVLVLDHTGKDLERGARGGSAKTDNIDLAFELVKRGRDTLTLRCTHARVRDELLDNPTMLRRTSDPLSHVIEHLGLSDEAAGATRPTFLMERVSRYIEANPGQSKTAIETAVKGKAEYVRLALELLVGEQYIEVRRGARGAAEHTSIRPFTTEGPTDD